MPQACFRQAMALIGLKQYAEAGQRCAAGLKRCPGSEDLLELRALLADLQRREECRASAASAGPEAAGLSALDAALDKLKQAGVPCSTTACVVA